MKKLITLFCFLLAVNLAFAQLIQPFSVWHNKTIRPSDKNITKFQSFDLNTSVFASNQASIPALNTIRGLVASNAIIELPLAEGRLQQFYIASIEILSPATAALYPQIKTYDLLSTDGTISGRATYSQMGFNIELHAAEGTQYITPFANDDNTHHAVYNKRDYSIPANLKVSCGVKDEIQTPQPLNKTTAVLGDCMLRTYNFAVAATGEFTTWAGGQANAVASITATLASINLIYERDMGIHFTLVTNNNVIFTNAATDPYATASFPTQAILDANTLTLDANILPANYDIGMVFNNGWNGGLAYTPGVCNTALKGGAASGITGNPAGAVMVNVSAHEAAHMFSANHTMSAGTGAGCTGSLNQPTAYEIGGGSTIMAYAGAVCTGLSYQNNTDDYFHYNSVATVRAYAQAATTCGVAAATTNTSPTLSVAASSYTIPISTPFELTATGNDADGNALTYTFEQYDAAATTMTATPTTSATTGPMFRSYGPSSSNTRVFPALANILANTTTQWEVLPSVSRAMTFKALVRDNATGKGCVAQEDITVNTNATAGPFAITSQNTASTFTANGTNTMTITWNVANSTAAPVNAANVHIYFSTDNGQTFPYSLATNTANDGTETILVPNLNTSSGRIKVKAANNIFFDINNDKVTINSSCTANGTTFSSDAALTAQAGTAPLNLSLSPNYGTAMTITGTLAATDPLATLAIVNISGSNCTSFSNDFNYDLFTFQVNVAGSYTFAASGTTPFGTMYNIYENTFTPSNPCQNFLTSNGVFNGASVSINSNCSATLTPGVTYVMAVGTFANGTPTLPASYTINVTPPTSGGIYSGTPNPGAGFSYRYVIVNNTTGNIKAITTTPNMTNTTTYPVGTYTVYGLSSSTAVTQTTLNTYVGGSLAAFQTALLNNTICGNMSSNSKLITITSNPTAIRNIQLTAQLQDQQTKLSWLVVGEENAVGYLAERSNDGINYKAIGNVVATQKGSYSLLDNAPTQGINYYRIKATELDHSIFYSNVAKVNKQQMSNGMISIYPNPTTKNITVSLPQEGNYVCQLTDVSGRVILSFTTTKASFEVDLKTFAPGIYILRCNDGQQSLISRVVKQ